MRSGSPAAREVPSPLLVCATPVDGVGVPAPTTRSLLSERTVTSISSSQRPVVLERLPGVAPRAEGIRQLGLGPVADRQPHPAQAVEAVERLRLPVVRAVGADVQQRRPVARPVERPVLVGPVERDHLAGPEPAPGAVVPPRPLAVERGGGRQRQHAHATPPPRRPRRRRGRRAAAATARRPRAPAAPGRAAAACPGRTRSRPCRRAAAGARAPAARSTEPPRRAGKKASSAASPTRSGAPSRIVRRIQSSGPS